MGKIIILGATSGLGRGVAETLLRKGWTVGVAGRDEARLAELATEWPGKVVARAIDITDKNAAQSLVRLIQDMGGVDIYFHCSGILPSNSELAEDDELLTVSTNVEGFTRMISAAYRYFRSTRLPGKIAAITSIAGIRGVAGLASYCASKSYDSTYLEALRQQANAEKLPVSIVDIRPGWVRTPLLDSDKKYTFEMSADKAVRLIVDALLHSSRGRVIGARWRFLCAIERIVPGFIWQRVNLPLWSSGR